MINLSQIIQIKQKKQMDRGDVHPLTFAARLFIQPTLLHLQFTKNIVFAGKKRDFDIFNFLSSFH